MPPRARGTTPPATLGTRGRKLWSAVTAETSLDPAGLLMLEEACRISDRLESLDAILRGDVDTWAVITDEYTAGGKRTVKVVLDDALGEARQQALALRQLLTTLKLGTAAQRQTQAGSLDQLAAARAQRRTASSG